MSGPECACLARNRHRVRRKNGKRMEDRTLAFAAIQAMADTDAQRSGSDLDAHCSAQASPGIVRHHFLQNGWRAP
jgi:hypothetical protein